MDLVKRYSSGTLCNWLILSSYLPKKNVLHCSHKTLLLFFSFFLHKPHIPVRHKSSHSQMFFKIDVLENFTIVTGSFNKVANLKRRLQHNCFPVNNAKFLRTAFFIEHFQCLLLKTNLAFLHCIIWDLGSMGPVRENVLDLI